jgi:hypothetical protein
MAALCFRIEMRASNCAPKDFMAPFLANSLETRSAIRNPRSAIRDFMAPFLANSLETQSKIRDPRSEIFSPLFRLNVQPNLFVSQRDNPIRRQPSAKIKDFMAPHITNSIDPRPRTAYSKQLTIQNGLS